MNVTGDADEMIGAVVVTFGFSIASAENAVYQIVDTRSDVAGFYVETEKPLSFHKLGTGNFTISFNKTGWKLDRAESETLYQADGESDKPPETGWKDRKNKNKEVRWKLKRKNSTHTSTWQQIWKDKGSATLDGGVLCLEQKTNKPKGIMLAGNDPKMCDGNNDCQGGWDEDCLGIEFNRTEHLVISGGDPRTRGVYNLTRRSTVPLFYSRVDGYGFVRWWSKYGEEGEWLIGGAKDGVIEEVYRAPGQESVPIESLTWSDARSNMSDLLIKPTNLSIETLLGRETLNEEVITCEGRDRKLLQIKREDNRTCDGHTWDCKNGRDERSCPFHRNLTDIILVTVKKDRSKRVSGIYNLQRHLGYYLHSKQHGFIFRKGDRWVIGIFKHTSRTGSTMSLTDEGKVDLDLISEIFTSGESTTVPEEDWREITYDGSKPASIIVSSLPESINATMTTDMSKTYKVEQGILCKAKIEDEQAQGEDKENLDYQWLFINFKGSTREKKCDGTWHCEEGQDEAECNNLASETFIPSIIVTSLVLLTGCLVQILRKFWSDIKEALPDNLKKTGNSIKKAISDCLKVDKERRKKPKKPKAKDLMTCRQEDRCKDIPHICHFFSTGTIFG